VFRPEEHTLPPGVYKSAAGLAETLLSQEADLNAPKTFQEYFYILYQTLVDRDAYDIQALRNRFDYPAVAEKFRMIQEDTVPVVIRDYEPAKVNKILAEGIDRWTMRALQPYLVNVYRNTLSRLEQDGLVQPITPNLWEWVGTYDCNLGIVEQSDVERFIA